MDPAKLLCRRSKIDSGMNDPGDHDFTSGPQAATGQRCTKFGQNKNIDVKKAVAFLKLRKDGVPSKEALPWCARTTCKFDSTKTTDGPIGFRDLLKIKKNENLLNVRGWSECQPIYDMGQGYCSSIEEIIPNINHTDLVDVTGGNCENDGLEEQFRMKVGN
jgi:hypothetical protein